MLSGNDADWIAYTPALTATGVGAVNPTLGTGGIITGRFAMDGKIVVAEVGIRFGTAARNKGTGVYNISLPVPAKISQFTAGLTSQYIGTGKLYQGTTILDAYAAHPEISFHTTNGTTAIMVASASNAAYDVQYANTSASQTGITSATDITSLTINVDVPRPSLRYKITTSIVGYPTALTVGSPNYTSASIQIREGATVKGSFAETAHYVGSTFGNGFKTFQAVAYIESPTVGTHTYKSTFVPVNATWATFTNSVNFGWILCEQLPGRTNSTTGPTELNDYVSDTSPWDWSAQTGQAEIWGRLIYEAA
jgi:hypothetical protein